MQTHAFGPPRTSESLESLSSYPLFLALRATSVVKYLVTEKGLDPSRFSASGYGEYQPLVPNISEANRRINRRVDIVIMKLD